MKVLLLLLTFALNLEPEPLHAQPKNDPFSSHRLIAYVLADETQKSAIENAIKRFEWEITDRDILLVNLGEIEISTQHSVSLTSAEKEAWRKLWQLGLGESRFVLVGKDGGAKAFQRNELSWQLFFDLIDQMPMRRAEMEETYQAAKKAKTRT